MKTISPDKFINNCKHKIYPPIPRNKEWQKLKWHVCKSGERLNPILLSMGGEIQVEQFGIIGCLFKVKDKTFKKKKRYFYQCPLIESREQGTKKFGEWLKNVKEFVWQEFKAPFALTNITNQKLYKYCEEYNISVAVNDKLYKVKVKKRDNHKIKL